MLGQNRGLVFDRFFYEIIGRWWYVGSWIEGKGRKEEGLGLARASGTTTTLISGEHDNNMQWIHEKKREGNLFFFSLYIGRGKSSAGRVGRVDRAQTKLL